MLGNKTCKAYVIASVSHSHNVYLSFETLLRFETLLPARIIYKSLIINKLYHAFTLGIVDAIKSVALILFQGARPKKATIEKGTL